MIYFLLFAVAFFAPVCVSAELKVGVATADITPPSGTPSAGYEKRKGAPMHGVHDLLLATAMVMDTGSSKIVFCSVDNLGIPQKLIEKVKIDIQKQLPAFSGASFFIGSSHTHSGGGSYFDVPLVGELLAGPYDEKIAQKYVDGIVEAIVTASNALEHALVGVGYCKLEGISDYRAKWPERCTLENDLAIIKVVKPDGSPLAVLFNFALHPTVLKADNMLFSSDFVGFARDELQNKLKGVVSLYFNGAQAEIIPSESTDSSFLRAGSIGKRLASAVVELWGSTKVYDSLDLQVYRHTYSFTPVATPFGLTVPLDTYPTELSLLVVNKSDVFVAVPGELSCVYNSQLKCEAAKLGFSHLSVLGLVNDAHGYILLPEAWHAKTMESGLSFGGEFYGRDVHAKIVDMLRCHSEIGSQ